MKTLRLNKRECWINGSDAFKWFYNSNKHFLKKKGSSDRYDTVKCLLHWRKKRGKKLLLRGDFGIFDLEDNTYFMSKSVPDGSYTSQTLKF